MGNQGKKNLSNDPAHSTGYMRWDNPTIIQGVRVAGQLQVWLNLNYEAGGVPVACITVACDGVILMIGDFLVWDSENYDIDDLTVEFCKARYKEQVMMIATPFRK